MAPLTKNDQIMRGGVFLDQPRPNPMGRGTYCCTPTNAHTVNLSDRSRNGNTRAEQRALGGQPRHTENIRDYSLLKFVLKNREFY